jgi:hypothetical protein
MSAMTTGVGEPVGFVESHTFAVMGKLEEGSLPPFYVALGEGEAGQRIVKIEYGLQAGTSATLKVFHNGAEVTGLTALKAEGSAKSTDMRAKDKAEEEEGKLAPLVLKEDDSLGVEISAISGEPEGLTVTIFVEHQVDLGQGPPGPTGSAGAEGKEGPEGKEGSGGGGFPGSVAMAYLNTKTKMPAAATLVACDTIIKDPGSNFDITDGYYVAPAEGYYQVDGNVYVSPSSEEYANISVRIGSTEVLAGSEIKNDTELVAGLTVGGIIFAKAGDHIGLYLYLGTAEKEVGAEGEARNRLSVLRVA